MDSSVNAPEPSALPTALHPDAGDRYLHSMPIIRKKQQSVKKKLILFSFLITGWQIHNKLFYCIS